ncbi:3-hydroxyacyl-CoA dehydrogenase NAD-binding domain-containing protein [Glaesserella parasuis]|uniref:3-hydroxyacyl-CoA dehydrogenase NAD-binding domain-containing protein n=1 Tax=Glaesserella parasuis TaxID=738 RepID=UPI00079FE253|nr:3-hydroxyacyl-CoA dehydrogenase NAD-binding domain-containing protein [Glaesserella parasuis]AMW17460.1 fatty-acid oxidation protein subunit alpha [Glaesserella parasuis]MDG6270963.1 3-hydroxyacyl-CoA dehydrogenase NAD-binding domain-containing protein [Glaesserella parasuis]MDG6306756.1 3-hydroxyacyl-CoA dehydrogenase NAD-binding domain-containing protein [Glaesserella parasuis]MDG6342803.1 3-hydroxyacyl-CoA dehydrogenase NAD-binding domain-containing protein [Glaesserella parasuis]MDG6485
MTTQAQYISPFHVEIDDNRIAIVRIDVKGKSQNWLPEPFIEDLRDVMGSVIYQQARGVIFVSGKTKGFIQGYDPDYLRGKNDEQLKTLSHNAQLVMREINTLKMPVVAVIDGGCYGVGLELALACDYRIASEESYTKFAMPQIRSGILPFAGGTQRLPRLVGLQNAVTMLLSGQKIGVEKALKIGLVDKLIPASNLFETAYQLLLNHKVQKIDHKNPLDNVKKWRKQLEGNKFIREKYLAHIENRVWDKAFGNYPAVEEMLALLKEPHFKAGLALEQNALVKLMHTEQAQVLMNLKQTERAMKEQYQHLAQVRDVQQVTVLGSGYMGAGIAYLTANNAQIPVRIKDIHPSEIQKALQTCYGLMQKAVSKKQLSHGEMIQRMNLITGGERLVAAKSTDFIVEAVYEKLELKQQMVQESENYYDENAIFATNTSTFAIRDIASVAKRPENVIGLHYFSPVTKRPMVEIIPHEKTCQRAVSTAIHFAIQQGKIPMLVADKEGFFINRILTPFLLEAIECLSEGEGIEFIDRALQEFGFKIGPLAMIDEIGLDIIVKSNPAMVSELGKRFALPTVIERLTGDDRKGRKNKRGFYLYDTRGARTQEDKSIYHTMETIMRNDMEAEDIARRCVLRMLNEACWCLQDQVIRSTDEGNVASVFGVDFADFRGGVYAYINKIGAKELVRQLRKHTQQYGERFTPCEWLVERAEKA